MSLPSTSPRFEQLKETARRLGIRRFWKSPPPPTNLRPRDNSADAVKVEARYGVSCGRAYLAHFRRCNFSVDGAAIAEIGPGVGFGAMAFLHAHGARVSVVDRWLAPWQPDFHGAYYAEVAEAAKDAPHHDRIGGLASAGSYRDGPFEMISAGAESLGKTHPCRFDAIVSNAVLEHVCDLAKSARALFLATRPGGIGLHQIDYRDHRNFDRPLDHLLFAPAAWKRMSAHVHWEYGSQNRPADYVHAFREAGFEVLRYECTDRATAAYIEEIRSRLARANRMESMSDDLFELSGHFTLRRPAGQQRQESDS